MGRNVYSMRIAIIAPESRGDVQPYVALGKGLMDAGHKYETRIPVIRGQVSKFSAGHLAVETNSNAKHMRLTGVINNSKAPNIKL